MRHRILRYVLTAFTLSVGALACQSTVHLNSGAAASSPPPPLLNLSPLRIANAGASPRPTPDEDATYVRLRSEGLTHALERNALGIALMSEANGVEGFMKSPSGDVRAEDVRWAGFVEKDALVVLVGETLHRAESMQDARDGQFASLPYRVSPGAHLFRSGGGKVIAYAQSSPARLYVSTDSGKTFSERKLPEQVPVIDLEVRRDGVIVLAHDRGKKKNSWNHEDQLAQIYVSRDATWTKGPRVQTYDASTAIAQHGDAITISSESSDAAKDDDGERGLTRNGTWVSASESRGYLDFANASRWFSPNPPTARPGYPSNRANASEPDLPDLVGGVMGTACAGVTCVSNRPFSGTSPRISVLHDGVCAASDVVTRKETVVIASVDGKPAHPEEIAHRECDPTKSAVRTALLAVPTLEAMRLSRLPSSCASGEIVGTAAAAFLFLRRSAWRQRWPRRAWRRQRGSVRRSLHAFQT